jgi:DNA segregation ATPase FtsK/SpoIIIE, S-DNA-T family
MKICPTCNKTYPDDDLNFCLADGATLLKKRGGEKKHSRTNEVVAIALLAAAVLVFLCLVSYHPSDPTFNTASSEKVRNWIGVVGANVAEALFSVSGVVSYLLPALLALIAWRVFQSEDLRPAKSRIAGFLFFVAAAAGLISLFGWHGGIVGAFFAANLVYLLSAVGAGILLAAVLLASMVLISEWSYLSFLGNFELAWANLKIHYNEWNERRKVKRAELKEAARERLEKRREVRDHDTPAEPPTIVVGESDAATVISGRKTMAASSAAGGRETIRDAILEAQCESIPEGLVPTISPPLNQPKTIVTDELNSGELPELVNRKAKPKATAEEGGGPEGGSERSAEDEIEKIVVTGSRDDFKDYVLPSSELLNPAAPHIQQKEKELLGIAKSLAEKTREFNVSGKVMNISPGPVVTTYEFKPDPGVKYSRVTGLVDDLCLALKAESIRIDRIPGKAYVGIEVPNRKRETIQLRDVVESDKFRDSRSLLTVALGKTIDGRNYVTDLARMPHLLIAGATGAGKSVGVNSLVVSILYKARPDEVKFIMVDPKRLELGVYADIPHLATPIITDPKKAATALKWAVTEMERRYKDLAGFGVRNIDGYNAEVRRRNELEQWDDNGEPHRMLPYVVIIIDELADLMMISGKDVEESITRLAQMARAVGIHLVLATQRPSVDVITGLIKANFPARISFRVSSKVDSRTIIDSNGAESLLGRGDMLFLPPASSQVVRVHGAFVDEKEIALIVGHIKAQGRPEYDTTITKSDEEFDDSDDLPGRRDPLFIDALKCVVHAKRGSTSLLQRHLRIGYGRAAAILDAMVREGYIGDMDGSTRARPVLQKAYDDLQDLDEMGSN